MIACLPGAGPLAFALLVVASLMFVLSLAVLRSLQWLAERVGARRPLAGPDNPLGGA